MGLVLGAWRWMGRFRSDYAVGVGLLVLSAVTFSSAGLFVKGVVAGAWAVIFWRGVFAVLATGLWITWAGRWRQNLRMGRMGWAVGVIGALGTSAFVPAFKLTSIANVALIYAASPLIAALLAWATLGERPSRRTLIGAFGALAGVAIIMWGSLGQGSLIGDLLALCMTLAMAGVMVMYRARPETPSAGPSMLQTGFLIGPALALGAPLDTSVSEIGILAAFGVLFALASITLAEGAKRVPAGQAALLSSLETPLAPVLALLVLSEMPSGATILGGAVVFLAVLGSIEGER